MLIKDAVYMLAMLIAICVPLSAARAGPDWPLNPICQAAEYVRNGVLDEALLKKCRDWISNVKQPTYPGLENQSRSTCCSEADAYEADSFEIGQQGEHFAIITRDYPDIKAGEKLYIPKEKFNIAYMDGNPTGHGIVFANKHGGEFKILCYFGPSLQ